MNWETEPLIKGKDDITEVTSEMLGAIRQEEERTELERIAVARRKINFERRKAAKEAKVPYVSIEEEERQKEEQQEVERSKKEEIGTSEVIKGLAEHRVTIVGKINLEEVHTKLVAGESHSDSFDSQSIDSLYRQALLILGNEEIDEVYKKRFIDDFITLYDYDEIVKDIQTVIEKEQQIKRSDTPERAHLKKLATILEAILVEGIAKYEWLGKKIQILPPSKFDELCRGIDAIIELARSEKPNEFLALGIDVSYRSVDGDLFEEKINNLLEDINHQHLTQIKYLKDNNGDPKEGLYVPKVIVSVDSKTTEDLLNLWNKRRDQSGADALKNHSIAIDIMGQIAEQCKLFSAYARKNNAEVVADAYDEVFDLLIKISEEIPQAREAITQFTQSKFVDKIEQIIVKKEKFQ